MPRYLIQSCTDGVVWETRDACENERQYSSSVESLELFDGDVLARYRVFDAEEQFIIWETPTKAEPKSAVVAMSAAMRREVG